jgi:Fic family protein
MDFRIPLDPEILAKVARLDHFRGSFAASSIPSERADSLRQTARIESVGANCRLAGIRVTDPEVAAILMEGGGPKRDRGEVCGLESSLVWPEIQTATVLSARDLARLHAVMCGADPGDPAPSPWRVDPISREAFDSHGNALGRVFQTLPPHLVVQKSEDLITWLELELRSGAHHPLPLIATFALALSVVSPFERANGRLARVMAVRLLSRAGYQQVRYSSWERVLEERREDYFEAIDTAATRLWAGAPKIEAWIHFFLDTLDESRVRLQAALDVERKTLKLSPLQRKVMETIGMHGTVDAALLLDATGANRNTLKDNMRRLVQLGLVEKMGERRGTRYKLPPGAPAGPAGVRP